MIHHKVLYPAEFVLIFCDTRANPSLLVDISACCYFYSVMDLYFYFLPFLTEKNTLLKSKPEAFFLHCHLMKMPFQVVGAENPVLMSAAEQIFGAGGKRMRPALVFLVSWATAELVGLK